MKLLDLRSALLVVCGGVVVLGASPVQAQSMKPGLWDIQQKMGGNPKMDEAMAKMDKQMAAMSPEQRKMMQDMMAKNGVGMGGPAAGGGMAMKVCITKEMSERQHVPAQTHGDCTTTVTEKSASGMKMSFVCKNPPSSGDGVYTFNGDSAYTMKMNVRSAEAKGAGAASTTTMEAAGKWVSGDCGTVKPMPMPAK